MNRITFFALSLCLFASFSVRGHETLQEISPRIIRGKIATVNQFPYQAGFIYYIGNTLSWCGGSLISDEWVLTAAVCTIDALSGVVYLGSNAKAKSEVNYAVAKSKITTHPKFNWKTPNIDNIGLIRIPKVSISNAIRPVALPKIGETVYIGSEAIASGWGSTSDAVPGQSDVLRYGDFKVIANAHCARIYGKGVVNDGTLCADHLEGNAICYGDYGGPLVSIKSHAIIGVAAIPLSKNCETKNPNFFTRVTYHLDWIHRVTGIPK